MTNFDRVAEIYDSTRELPPAVPGLIAERVVAATRATQDTRLLEVGVGTGRIAIPFIERGHRYTGVDISERMMDQLRAKLRGREDRVTLVNSDIAHLPFEDASFDVAIAVHVFHLLPDWRQAFAEVRRVLTPDGFIILGYDSGLPGDPANEIRAHWRKLVEESGVTLASREGTWSAIDAALTAAGAYTAVYRVAHWETEFRPIDLLNEQRNRVFSLTWEVPQAVLEAVHQRMLRWATEKYGPIDRPLRTEWEFMLSVSRFP